MAESIPSLAALRRHIASLDRAPARDACVRFATGHGPLDAMLGGGLARGRVHEVFGAGGEEGAATGLALLWAQLAGGNAPLLWLRSDGAARIGGLPYGPGLAALGLDPARLLLGAMPDDAMLLRAAVDALRCPALGGLVMELRGRAPLLDLTASRRLALAAEASGVTALLLVKVVPQFESLFQGFGAELPVFTQFTVHLSQLTQAYWWQAMLALVVTILGVRQAMKRSPAFAYRAHQLVLKLPVIGNIIDKGSIARFSRTLATTFNAGIPLVEALDTAAGATGNQVHQRAIAEIREDVATGQQLNFAMRRTKVFPVMAVQMVSIGEEAGELDTMLDKVAEFYEEEVDNQVDTLTSLLEPFILVVLGTMVGGLVVSMYLPIFQMGSAI